jgi:hypothetical protein
LLHPSCVAAVFTGELSQYHRRCISIQPKKRDAYLVIRDFKGSRGHVQTKIETDGNVAHTTRLESFLPSPLYI